jgi:DNA-directed RNA polymerase specialized sigma24 family protein
MEQLRKLALLDEHGRPVDERTLGVLEKLHGKFRKHFRRIQDESVVTTIFEKVATMMARRERTSGPLERPYGYAWRALQSIAISNLRGTSIELHRHRAEPRDGRDVVRRLEAMDGTPHQIERDILMKELLAQLTPEEAFVLAHKMAGHTSAAIAAKVGCAPATVDVTVWRIRQKLRAFVNQGGATL